MKEYLTKENKATLEAELKELTSVKRREILNDIEHAKALGDLSENAEYHQAREEQGRLEERIGQIEYVLKNAVVIERVSSDNVGVGAVVTIQKEGETNTRMFQIVGSEETDMLSGKISYKSPLGEALIGKKVGEKVVVTTPKGAISYKIISLQ